MSKPQKQPRNKVLHCRITEETQTQLNELVFCRVRNCSSQADLIELLISEEVEKNAKHPFHWITNLNLNGESKA